MKKHNPSTPIMLREAQGTLPKVYARYEFGKEKSQSLEGTKLFRTHAHTNTSGIVKYRGKDMGEAAHWCWDGHDR